MVVGLVGIVPDTAIHSAVVLSALAVSAPGLDWFETEPLAALRVITPRWK